MLGVLVAVSTGVAVEVFVEVGVTDAPALSCVFGVLVDITLTAGTRTRSLPQLGMRLVP